MVKHTKFFADTTSSSSTHRTHLSVFKVPSAVMGRRSWKKLWGGGVKAASPCLGRKGESSRCCAVEKTLYQRTTGRLPAPTLPPENQENLPCSKPQFFHWLKEGPFLVLSLPSPCSQKASSFFLTHGRHHFLEDLARCGPPDGSFLG